jgi:hypothetical protein
MEILLIISNLILVALTGFYGWFTYEMLRRTQRDNHLYREAIAKQLRLTTMPYLYCDLRYDFQTQQMVLGLYNIGTAPAYDLHISSIGAFNEEALDVPGFMRNYVQPRYRKYPLQVDKVGYYGVRSLNRVACLSAQKQLAIALAFPIRPVDIYVLVQYRELLGDHYYQLYCFSDLNEQGDYKANILEPQTPQTIERLHLYDLEDASLPTSQPLPYHLNDFVDLWNHSLSVRLTSSDTNESSTLPAEP